MSGKNKKGFQNIEITFFQSGNVQDYLPGTLVAIHPNNAKSVTKIGKLYAMNTSYYMYQSKHFSVSKLNLKNTPRCSDCYMHVQFYTLVYTAGVCPQKQKFTFVKHISLFGLHVHGILIVSVNPDFVFLNECNFDLSQKRSIFEYVTMLILII